MFRQGPLTRRLVRVRTTTTAGTWMRSKCVSRSSHTCPKAVTTMPTSNSTPCLQRLECVRPLAFLNSTGFVSSAVCWLLLGDGADLHNAVLSSGLNMYSSLRERHHVVHQWTAATEVRRFCATLVPILQTTLVTSQKRVNSRLFFILWGFLSSEMWYCVFGWEVPEVLVDYSALVWDQAVHVEWAVLFLKM